MIGHHECNSTAHCEEGGCGRRRRDLQVPPHDPRSPLLRSILYYSPQKCSVAHEGPHLAIFTGQTNSSIAVSWELNANDTSFLDICYAVRLGRALYVAGSRPIGWYKTSWSREHRS